MTTLFLQPHDPLWRPQNARHLVDGLRQLGLLGEPLDAPESGAYRVGSEFLKLVVFLGCSPYVVLDPGDSDEGQAACSIRLAEYPAVVFLASHPLPRARCPCCRAPSELTSTAVYDAPSRCASCGEQTALHELDWRQGAGYGSFFVAIDGIHPQEAIPSERLLGELEKFSGCAWRFFFRNTRA